jgi:hypothetical protein
MNKPMLAKISIINKAQLSNITVAKRVPIIIAIKIIYKDTRSQRAEKCRKKKTRTDKQVIDSVVIMTNSAPPVWLILDMGEKKLNVARKKPIVEKKQVNPMPRMEMFFM